MINEKLRLEVIALRIRALAQVLVIVLLSSGSVSAQTSGRILSGNFSEWPDGFNQGEIPGAPAGDDVFIFPVRSGADFFYPGGAAKDRFWFRDTACDLRKVCYDPARSMYFYAEPLSDGSADQVIRLYLSGDMYSDHPATVELNMFVNHYEPLVRLRFSYQPTSRWSLLVTAIEPNGKVTNVSRVSAVGKAAYFASELTLSVGAEHYDLRVNDSASLRLALGQTVGEGEPLGVSLSYVNERAAWANFRLNDLWIRVEPVNFIRVPISYRYNYTMSSAHKTRVDPGSYFEIYNRPGGGAYGNDIARCYVDDLGGGRVALRAYNKDSASQVAIVGTAVRSGCSTATYSRFVVECCIDPF